MWSLTSLNLPHLLQELWGPLQTSLVSRVTFTELQFHMALLCWRKDRAWEGKLGSEERPLVGGLGRLDVTQGTLHARPVTLMVLGVLPPLQSHLVTYLPHWGLGAWDPTLPAMEHNSE